ncbi:MAG: sulfatase-like hydrolase/transferase [Candidatus Azobacteroides sp.]|nr:sulfatase-like hydrolase/transferase [Candidatus Azobacteroides sp.]
MGKRVLSFFLTYFFFMVFFLLEKIFFMFFHFDIYKEAGVSNWITILKNGFPLDFSMAGYLTVLPGIFLILSLWIRKQTTIKIFSIYFLILSIFLGIIFIVDPVLFGYWGVHLDSTVFMYMKNMKDVFASLKASEIAGGGIGMVLIIALIFLAYRVSIQKILSGIQPVKAKWKTGGLLLLLTGLLFIPIRGGFTVSTMNVGKVYFSTNSFYNQAAINPYFNFIYSLTKSENFSEEFHFMPEEKMQEIMKQLLPGTASDSIPMLLNNENPNIILFVLEGFGSVVIEPLGGEKNVTPNLSRLAEEGILFSHFYTNTFRTDRGLISVLSGYPAQAMTSIMKYPNKTRSLPAIPKTLGREGYSRELIYGGDIDFTNMRSYFFGCCNFEEIVSDVYFPLKDRLSKWGVPDHIVIDTLANKLQEKNLQEPFFKMVLTLSSHEPFIVPFNRLENPYLNSVAYTDSCLGDFVEKFRKTPYWDNTLLIFVPDHAAAYPPKIEIFNPERYKIPLIWSGGAVKNPAVIDKIGSQMDLAAILFSQMNVAHEDFIFSKNILDPHVTNFAYYSYNNGFGMIDTTGTIVYDKNADQIIYQTENPDSETLLEKGKAFTQFSYMDFDGR